MHKVNLLRALLISLALLSASAACAGDLWGTYGSWPLSGWTPLPSLNDGRDSTAQAVATNLDIVGNGSPAAPGAYAGYVNWDSSYLYVRMRLDGMVDSTFGNALYLLLDSPYAATPGVPDWAISWTNKPNPTGGYGGLDLMLLEQNPADNKWLWQSYTFDADATGYVRSTLATNDIGFGTDDCYVDWAIEWNWLTAETEVKLGDSIGFQFATGGDPYNPKGGPGNKNNLYDIAGGETATNNEQFNTLPPYSFDYVTTPEPASMALTLLAVGFAGGVARRRKTKNEAGREE